MIKFYAWVVVCLAVLSTVKVQAQFAAGETASTGFNARAMGIGDINGDGVDDIMVADQNGMTLLYNRDSGSFSSFTFVSNNSGTECALIADLDKTNGEDLVRGVNNGDFEVYLSLDTSGTNYDTPTTYTDGVGGSNIVRAADLNGDTWLDLVVADNNGVLVYTNDQDGTFTLTDTLTAVSGGQLRGLDVGDIDGDTDIDIAASNISGGSAVRVWKNRGNTNANPLGDFDAAAFDTISIGGSSARGIALMNFDVDSNLEIVVCRFSDFEILDNNGSGDFSSSGTITGSQTEDLDAVDMTGDGIAEIIYAPNSGGNTLVLEADGDGTFDTTSHNLGSIGATSEMQTGDFDGNGLLDVVVSEATNNRVTVFLATSLLPVEVSTFSIE